MSDERPVKSPCVSVCALDEQDICIGCQRTAAEITLWAVSYTHLTLPTILLV